MSWTRTRSITRMRRSIAWSQFVITLVADPERVLSECARVLRPGGEIILVNHFYSERGAVAAIERWSARYVGGIGLRPDFPFSRLLRWAERSDGIVFAGSEPVEPLPWDGARGGDARLRVLVPLLSKRLVGLKEGKQTSSWALVATHLPGRTGRECRERWGRLAAGAAGAEQPSRGAADAAASSSSSLAAGAS